MRWYKPNLKSIYSLLGQPDRPPAPPADTASTEEVRFGMLAIMSAAGVDLRNPAVFNKVRYAGSIQSLWYARSDVMAALSSELGEASARRHVVEMTARFKGLLPEARDVERRLRPR